MLSVVSLLVGPVVALALGAGLALAGWRFDVRRRDAVLLGGPPALAAGAVAAYFAGAVDVRQVYSSFVALALVASVGVLGRLDRPQGAWAARLRRRLLFGVPWGTLVVVAVVLADYLFLQDGLHHPYAPVTIPFTSWSYLYPLGVVTAPFSHVGLSHITGNLIGTVVLAPIAEYAFGHYPERDGAATFSGVRTNPYARAFLLFPLGVVAVAEATSLLAWGPIIGFSGVVFAFLGFALTQYPVATIVALAMQAAVRDVYSALREPVVFASAGPSYGGPWWAGIAVQGHLTGLLIGVLLGALYAAHRGRRPSALKLWGAVVVAGFSLPLWTLWWYAGPETYVLFRWLGVVLVLAIGALTATAVRATDRDLQLPVDFGFTRRQVAVLGFFVPLVFIAGVAIPLNLTTVAADRPPGGVSVHGYRVTYGEHVPNQRVNVVQVTLFGVSSHVNASGVIVVDPAHHVWTQAISNGSLAYWGNQSVRLGGVGWSKSVGVSRRGWVAAGNETAYRIALHRPGGHWQTAYTSPPVRASPTIDGRNVSIAAANDTFTLTVSRGNRTIATGRLPANNSSVSLGGLRFVHRKNRLLATANGTRVTVAERETYH